MNAPSPTIETVQYYIKKWTNDTLTQHGEKSLVKLFTETYPKNTDFDEILIKVCTLNCIYSTNIQQDHIVLVAKHIIRQKDIDARIESRDLTLIEDLSMISLPDEKKQSFYSFMTKYCGHHVKPLKIDDADYDITKEFPAFDSIAEEMLKDFNYKDHFTEEFEKADLKNYPRFVEIMSLMRKHYKLEDFTLKEIDIYLNLCGRNEIKRQKNNKKLPRQTHPRKFGQDSTVSTKERTDKKPRWKASGKTSNSKTTASPSSKIKTEGRPSSERPAGGKSYGNKSSGGRPSNSKQYKNKQSGGRPSGSGRPTSGRPSNNRPQGR